MIKYQGYTSNNSNTLPQTHQMRLQHKRQLLLQHQHRPKFIKSSEYKNLRQVVPSLRRQRDVGKVEVVTEAARYIDYLHKTLIERFVLCGIPESLKDILGTDDANELNSQHIMNLVTNMANQHRLAPQAAGAVATARRPASIRRSQLPAAAMRQRQLTSRPKQGRQFDSTSASRLNLNSKRRRVLPRVNGGSRAAAFPTNQIPQQVPASVRMATDGEADKSKHYD